jgi:hypothetical protein
MNSKGTKGLAFALGNIVGALGSMPKDINFLKIKFNVFGKHVQK